VLRHNVFFSHSSSPESSTSKYLIFFSMFLVTTLLTWRLDVTGLTLHWTDQVVTMPYWLSVIRVEQETTVRAGRLVNGPK
jgi:hypothetical protein